MSKLIRAAMTLVVLVAMALVMSACGDDDDDNGGGGAQTTGGGESADLIERDPANGDTRISIGSKNFDEQYILGEIYAQALAAAGFDVRKELDLGSEQVAFRALKNGDIDAYPEYTGTALTSFYRVKVADVPRDPDEAFTQLEQELEGDSITAMPQTPFQNTYLVTSTRETAEEFGSPETLTELVEEAGNDVRLSGFPECRQRTDCYLGLRDSYDWTPEFVSSEGQYDDLDNDQADFTMGFSTDGPLSLDKYHTYEDDQGLFPPYYVTLLSRDDAADKLGDAGREIIERIQEPLDETVMRELNSRVSIDKETPRNVAAAYLRESGFTE